jgi:pSer/pThr/pTyr-binding forkhead associated (FHA) protein
MSTGFIVRVVVFANKEGRALGRAAEDAPTKEYRFPRLPVSLGRSPDNDICIAHHFVSSAHARIEEIGGRVCVRDLGSRNGVQVLHGETSVRIPANAPYVIGSNNFDFYLGSQVWVHVEGGRPAVSAAPRPMRPDPPPVQRSPLPPSDSIQIGDGLPVLPQVGRPPRDLPPLPDAGPGMGFGGGDPGGLSLPAVPRRSGGDGGGGGGWDSPPPSAPPRAGGGWDNPGMSLPPQPQPRGFEAVRPGQGPSPDRGRQARGPEMSTGGFSMNPEALALQGLREMLSSLTPGRALESSGDIARVITRLHNTIEVLCRSFLSLRDVHAKFVAGMHLQRSALYEPARVALDTARDPAAVAGHLLDFREGAADGPQALEAALKELSLHQVALLDGLMQGIRALLDELSPEAIASEVDQKRSGPRLGRAERALWEEYQARYERFASEGEAFSRIFGEEFASAYRNYRRNRGSR